MNWDGKERRNTSQWQSEEILKNLTAIQISIAIQTQQIASNHSVFNSFQEDIKKRNDELHEAIHGNGKPGMKSDIEGLKKWTVDHSTSDYWLQGILITGIIALLGWTVFVH